MLLPIVFTIRHYFRRGHASFQIACHKAEVVTNLPMTGGESLHFQVLCKCHSFGFLFGRRSIVLSWSWASFSHQWLYLCWLIGGRLQVPRPSLGILMGKIRWSEHIADPTISWWMRYLNSGLTRLGLSWGVGQKHGYKSSSLKMATKLRSTIRINNKSPYACQIQQRVYKCSKHLCQYLYPNKVP